jgi:hypothetical protein
MNCLAIKALQIFIVSAHLPVSLLLPAIHALASPAKYHIVKCHIRLSPQQLLNCATKLLL